MKKEKKKSHKKTKKSPTPKSNQFNKTFHLAEVNDDPTGEGENYEYFAGE